MQSSLRIVLVAVLCFTTGVVVAASTGGRPYGNDDLIIGNVPCASASCDVTASPTATIGPSGVGDSCGNYGVRLVSQPPRGRGAPINIAGGLIGLGSGSAALPAHRNMKKLTPSVPVVAVLVERCVHYPAQDGYPDEKRLTTEVIEIPYASAYPITVHVRRSPAP